MPLKDALTTTAGTSYVVAPKVAEGDTRNAVANPFDSIQASIEGFSTMTRNILEHSFKEVYYPLRNGLANYAHLLRHPVDTFNGDQLTILPKLLAQPITGFASAVTGAVRSILEIPEDIVKGMWHTPIDAFTAGTIGQAWLPGRMIHYAGKIVSATPSVITHYTTSLLGRGIDMVGDAATKVTDFDAVPDSWKKYVTPGTFTLGGALGGPRAANDNNSTPVAANDNPQTAEAA